MTEAWPPPYTQIFIDRSHRLAVLRKGPEFVFGAEEYYKHRPIEFIEHFCDTVDPRNAGDDHKLVRMPFALFQRQKDMVNFLYQCFVLKNNGLIEKCRDFGATWVCGAFSVWLWRFYPGSAVGWGSRKEDLVDKLGDMSSIFEKMRAIIDGLPAELLPFGFDPKKHMTYMKIINPANGATIIGESGDEIGRGGRTTIFFKDEAQPLSAKILTPNGWSNMGAMKIGSQVIGSDGKPCNVIGINDVGPSDVYKVGFSDGTFAKCSPNHLWTVDKVRSVKERMTLRTVQLMENLFYLTPAGAKQYNYRVPVSAPVEFEPQNQPHPLDPYLVGALLGDGGVSGVPEHSPKITTIDQEIIEQFKLLLPEGCTITQDGEGISWRLGDVDGRRGWKHKSRSRQAVVASGIAGKRSWEKRIPQRYMFASIEDRLSLLQGLMDTDGSASNNYGGSASFHTSSQGLAEDVRFIVESLGGTATHNIKKDARGFRDQHVLHIALDMPVFRLTRKLEQFRKRKQKIDRTIVSIEHCGKDWVRCISVDNADGLYLTDSCIVTHNCAHYERPEKIQAALDDNTNVQIDISSVNGLGNVFHRRRESGIEWIPMIPMNTKKIAVFVADWSDHPAKDQEWYDTRQQNAIEQGLLHKFAQEIDRNYAASVAGVIISATWVRASIGAAELLGLDDSGEEFAALDVADDTTDGDLNAASYRKGIVLKAIDSWGGVDTGESARRSINFVRDRTRGKVIMMYDSIGVGAGAKGEFNRMSSDPRTMEMMNTFTFSPWAASAKVLWPEQRSIKGDKESRKNKDQFMNLKGQGWYSLAMRFYRTWRAVEAHKAGEHFEYDPNELISISPDIPKDVRLMLEKELSQAVRKADAPKFAVNKKPPGTKSPNLADSVVMNYFPNNTAVYQIANW